MDYKRIALAAVVAWVVDTIYSIAVWMMMLSNELARYPAVFRPEADMNANMPLVLAGSLLGIFALVYMYAKGYEGGNGVMEGIRFGVVVAVFLIGFVTVGIYGSFNLGRRIAVFAAVTTFVEMIVVGAVIGALYRPATQPHAMRAAAV